MIQNYLNLFPVFLLVFFVFFVVLLIVVVKIYMQYSGSGLLEFLVSCQPIWGEHCYMDNMIIKNKCICSFYSILLFLYNFFFLIFIIVYLRRDNVH